MCLRTRELALIKFTIIHRSPNLHSAARNCLILNVKSNLKGILNPDKLNFQSMEQDYV